MVVEATVIAWIWARTVTCSNPGCGATMPLASSFWLGKKKGKEAWIRTVIEGREVRFEIGHDKEGPSNSPKVGRGAKFRCLVCGETAKDDHIKAEGMAGRMGAQLMAIAAEGDRRRVYLPPTDEHVKAADVEQPEDVPRQELPHEPRAIWCKLYGLTTWADLFTNRQLTALTTFSDLVDDARNRAESDSTTAGLSPDAATAYSDAVATYLALATNRLTNEHSTICTWASPASKEHVRATFARQALPMTWDFAEASPFCDSTGSFTDSIYRVALVLDFLRPSATGVATQADVRKQRKIGVWATDPPYYDNIGYADLSDYFYGWARRTLGKIYPELFDTIATPKSDELIASPYRHDGSKQRAQIFFQDGFVEAFASALDGDAGKGPMTVFYAFKQAEAAEDNAIASTGWSTMLEGLATAGWMVTATWPLRTEKAGRSTSIGSNALASSVALACRPRRSDAGITDRQGFVRTLQGELDAPLRELQKANIAPVDLRQAAIGPGMAIYSRFAKVVEPDGTSMRVHTALGLINQVLDQVLNEQTSDLDAETRWATQWFAQQFFEQGPYGTAEQLAVSMNIAVGSMVASGILESGGGKVRLLDLKDLPDDWDPVSDIRTSVWEATHHLVKRLAEEGEAAAGQLLKQLGGLGDAAHQLAYRLYAICERPRPTLAGPYNALVTSWPEIQRLAQEAPAPTAPQQQSLET